MERINKNRPLFMLGIAILYLVVLLVYLYMIQPTEDRIGKKYAEIAQLEQQKALITRKISEKKNENTAKLTENDVQDSLPLWDNVEQLILDLKTVGGKTHVKLENASFSMSDGNRLGLGGNAGGSGNGNEDGTANGASTVKEIQVTTSLQGSYANLLDWMKELQDLPRLVNIDTFTIEKKLGAAASDDPIKINLTFTAYFDSSYEAMVKDRKLPFTEN